MSKLDEHKETVLAMKAEGRSNRAIGHWHGVSEKSVRRALKRWATADDARPKEQVVFTTQSTRLVTDPEELMRELGVDPSDWHVDSIDVNRWGNVDDPNYQLKVRLKNLKPENLILAPEIPDLLPRIYSKPSNDEAELVVFVSDFHAPFHDPHLLRQFIDWLATNQPHRIIVGGDLGDFPAQSRHRHKPEWNASAQECVNAMFQILLAIRLVCPNAEIVFLPGNHDERIRNAIIDHNQGLFELRAADQSGEPQALSVWDIRNLLHLDKLGISYIDPAGTYEYALYPISTKLAATHGWIAQNKSGYSAAKTLESLGHSVIVGHTHRRGFYYETTYEIDGTPRDRVAVEAGCMCLHKKGLGYARAANWQQGFVTVSVHADGTFAIDPASYVNKKLLWHGQVYV